MQSSTALDHTEANIRYQSATWDLAPHEAALVLVDVWEHNSIRSHHVRASEIIERRIVPVVEAARRLGVTVIHAPSAEVAARYTGTPRSAAWSLERTWTTTARRMDSLRKRLPWRGPAWPPAQFRERTGPYARYARKRPPVWNEPTRPHDIHRSVAPRPGEPVIASGGQLHQLLRRRRILHLFYAGFATNLCLKWARDYSMVSMYQRGYSVILLRDCTTGIETADTISDLLLTRAATLELEHLGASATGAAFVDACQAACSG